MEALLRLVGFVVVFGMFFALLFGWVGGVVSASRKNRTGWVVGMVLFPPAAVAWWLMRDRQ